MPNNVVNGIGNKVLVVDDEPHMRETLAEIFGDEGYQVLLAASGEEAIEVCERENPHIVLMDVRMPGMDGVEAFRRIRRHQEGMRVILMSAYGMDSLKEAALEEGAIAFLSKPLEVERVVDLISESRETTILVIEPEEDTAKLLSGSLKEQGYWVKVTPSPHDALELVEQIRFDLIFLDCNLPSMNSLELYLAIKKITPSAVSIMIAGLEEEFEKIGREAVRRSAYTLIRKPLDINHTLSLLERITRQRVSGSVKKPPATG